MSELFDAIKRGDAAAVQSIIKRDPAQANAQENNVSAILTAMYHGHADIARLLADDGSRLTFPEACAIGDLGRVRKLLDADPSVIDAKSDDGFPALSLAIFFRHPEVAKFLIERGADVNVHADNAMRVAPLHAATASGNREIVKLLLERGADPNALQQMDAAPLHNAAGQGDIEMAKLLLDKGARPDAKMSDGTSVRDFAVSRGKHEFADWLRSVT